MRQRRKTVLSQWLIWFALFTLIYLHSRTRVKKQTSEREFALERVLATALSQANYNSYSRFSDRLTRLLSQVEHIYLMTTKLCQFENLPSEWSNSSSCVNVLHFDRQLYGDEILSYDHHSKITRLHLAFLRLARLRGYKNFAVIEADSVCVTQDAVNHTETSIFSRFLKNGSWDLIRFGYRPFFLENIPASAKCPRSCKCAIRSTGTDTLGQLGCLIDSADCDIRSSDMYVVNAAAYGLFESNLEKYTVDTEAMRKIERMWFIVPQMSFQVDSGQFLETQRYYAGRFMRSCVAQRAQ